jgi:formylglycine-generating enzyme required for sulfatase activity
MIAGCGQQDLYEPPGSPYEIVGQLHLPSINEGVDVLGTTAFVAAGEAGLHSIDFSNPSVPILLHTVNTTKYAYDINVISAAYDSAGIFTVADVAHIIEGSEGVSSFDVTDPNNVRDMDVATTAVDAESTYIEESDDATVPYHVYLAESWHGLRVFSSLVDQPGYLGYDSVFTSTLGYAKSVHVQAGFAYVADDEMGLTVVDVRVLEANQIGVVSWCDSPGNALDIVVEDDYAYVADGSAGLSVFAIDDGEAPIRVTTLDLGGYCRGIDMREGLVVIAAGGAGVHFVDVANPEAPIYLGTTVTTYAMDVVLADDGHCLVADETDGLVILAGRGPFADTRGPARPHGFTATGHSNTIAQLTWFMPGNDGWWGNATEIEVRRSDQLINSENWDDAEPVSDLPPPGERGQPMEMFVQGLIPGTTYFFATRAGDDVGHWSTISASDSVTTVPIIHLYDPTVSPGAGTIYDTFTFEIFYAYSDSALTHEVVIDDTFTYDLELIESTPLGDHYRLETTLPGGEHTTVFRFTAAGSPPVASDPITGPVVSAIAFTMGSPPDEPGRDDDESLHEVGLPFLLITEPHEVFQAQWDSFMVTNPSHFTGDDLPVEGVDWLEAIRFCNLRSQFYGYNPAYEPFDPTTVEEVTWNRASNGWRLPTEAEWEYLCRADLTDTLGTAFYAGDITALVCEYDPVLDGIGWYCGNAGSSTHDVGSKAPNDFGLYDMSGNVKEWCWDWYQEDLGTDPVFDTGGPDSGLFKVVRGGSWYYASRHCRSAARDSRVPDSTDDTVGFRVVRTNFSD